MRSQVSPDGKWLAYASDESGDWEVYIEPLPKSAVSYRSHAADLEPRWRRDGKEIFYVSYVGWNKTLMAVPVNAEGGLPTGRPAPLFQIAAAELSRPPIYSAMT